VFGPIEGIGWNRRSAYFVVPVVGALVSSMIHGQKFWGLRVSVAFLMTVIFMILLRLG